MLKKGNMTKIEQCPHCKGITKQRQYKDYSVCETCWKVIDNIQQKYKPIKKAV